ncbi:acyl-CoA dehydrogenase family protein [Azospirillum soli]|uniref:acyl-CoA dehydrogenase family protein n=1 Tax=Azospirillum soli TaxID=1304799 RepID=UPI001AEB75A6|nr:alkylation response protein AidB-like acyl-CoA dehydrogenase [Azospirillum soli]
MDFTFSDDQLEFTDTVAKFLRKEVTPTLIRSLWETEDGRSPELAAKLAELGLPALSVPEALGGLGLGDVDWLPLAREFGYSALPDALLDTAWLAAGALAEDTGNPVCAELLTAIAAGEARIAVGHPANPLVEDAHRADRLLLLHDDGLHLVPASEVRLEARGSLDPSRRLFAVGWQPRAETRLTADPRVAARLFDRGALAVAAQLVGLSQRILDLSTQYTGERQQFGKAIGTFQAVKHRLADVAVLVEFAKPVLERAAYALANGDPLAPVFVSHARVAAGDAAAAAARNGIQVHGAIGYTWELDLQIFMKRIWALDGAWGPRRFHKARVSDFVVDRAGGLDPGDLFAAAS